MQTIKYKTTEPNSYQTGNRSFSNIETNLFPSCLWDFSFSGDDVERNASSSAAETPKEMLPEDAAVDDLGVPSLPSWRASLLSFERLCDSSRTRRTN